MTKCVGSIMIILMIIGPFLLAGCQESNESELVKKARLVGQENIELRKQIKQKEQEIQNQKDQLEERRQELIQCHEEATDTGAKMLEIAGNATSEAEELRVENEKLKTRIQQLESQGNKP